MCMMEYRNVYKEMMVKVYKSFCFVGRNFCDSLGGNLISPYRF